MRLNVWRLFSFPKDLETQPHGLAPTPTTAMWYSPCCRVGEPCGRGTQIPSNGVTGKGNLARNTSRGRFCEGVHLEGITFLLKR